MRAQRRLALFAQAPGALLDRIARDLRHTRRRRARPRRKREDVQLRQSAFLHQIERAREHILGLGGEAGDDVGAEHDIRPRGAHTGAEGNGVGARVPPLHALEDQVIAGLKRQMQMRHHTPLIGQCVEKIVVGLHRVDGGEAQARQIRHVVQYALDQRAQPRRARQIAAVAGDIDAGEHHFAVAARSEAAHLRQYVIRRQ